MAPLIKVDSRQTITLFFKQELQDYNQSQNQRNHWLADTLYTLVLFIANRRKRDESVQLFTKMGELCLNIAENTCILFPYDKENDVC